MTAAASPLAALVILLRALKLPTVARHADEVAQDLMTPTTPPIHPS